MRAVTFLSIALLAVGVAAVQAKPVPELRVFAGAYVPTGDQADLLESSMMIGTQVGIEAASMVHLIGTFAYATPEAERPSVGRDVHVYQYDAGAEIFRVISASRENDHWTFRPFLGAGLGARTYDFHDVDSGSETNFVGYASLGTEFQHKNVALRIEARDYLSRFSGLPVDRHGQHSLTDDGDTSTRNDLVFGGGLALHF
jgi:hypothetical protein